MTVSIKSFNGASRSGTLELRECVKEDNLLLNMSQNVNQPFSSD